MRRIIPWVMWVVVGAPLAAQMPAPSRDTAFRTRGIDTILADGGFVTVTQREYGVLRIAAVTPTGTFPMLVNQRSAWEWGDSAAVAAANLWTFIVQPDSLIHGERRLEVRRMSADSASAYELWATNGAWDGTLVLSASAARQLFGTLNGPAAWRVTVDTLIGEKRMPTPLSGLYPRYPKSLERKHVTGRVLMAFLIDSTGRVDPRSIWLIASAHPLMSQAVRESLLQFTFVPATLDGRRVPQLVMQWFDFSIRRQR
jgi:TonB family protein